jgi:hypothetical protein
MIVGFVKFFMEMQIGQLAIYLGFVVLWGGLYYIWNLIAIEITVDLMGYMDYKHPDLDYYTIPKIIERTKNKYGEQRLRWNNRVRDRAN